ncbi:hypothetical protein QUF90_12710 [Desulfococcaceae bacterium HSG9]|nr:hypothetical protein [Desulfococcaceae bacterium HSG9]
MKKRVSVFNGIIMSGALSVLIMFSFFDRTEAEQKKQDLELIANIVSKDFAEVTRLHKVKDTPVIIVEESHDSLSIQIQSAIALVRLHEKYGMKDIALEGYLKERAKINTQWFDDATKCLKPLSKTGIAVSLLKEGEINSAEFMKLVYDDVELHPIETEDEYEMKFESKKILQALNSYLTKISKKSSANQKWAQDKIRTLSDKKAIKTRSIEENFDIVEAIKKRAEKLSLKLRKNDRQAMKDYLDFLRKRKEADKTLFKLTEEVADQEDISIVAMIVGRAHTEGISEMLEESCRPFAVVTPLSLKNLDEKGLLPWEMFERKYKKISVYKDGFFTETLIKTFSSSLKKPESVLNEDWFQSKSVVYAYTTRIVDTLLGDGGGPCSDLKKREQPFSNDEFKFEEKVFIDTKNIRTVDDDVENHKGKAVLFPVVFYPDDSKKRTEIWIKAVHIATDGTPDVEAMLQEALKQIQSKKEVSPKLGDESGKIKMSQSTVSVVAPTMEEALQAQVAVL